MEVFNLKASGAREIADNSNIVKKRIGKLINEAAKEGCVQTSYSFDSISKNALLDIIEMLNALGYGTSIKGSDDDGDCITIDKIDCDLKECELIISW